MKHFKPKRLALGALAAFSVLCVAAASSEAGQKKVFVAAKVIQRAVPQATKPLAARSVVAVPLQRVRQ